MIHRIGAASVVGMAMAARSALLRSVATKMARARPRLQHALEDHGRRLPTSPGSSRFSTSTGGSMPPPANPRGPQTHDNNNNKKVPSGSDQYDRLIASLNEAASIATFFLLAGIAHMHFCVSPRLDRIEASRDRQFQAQAALREDNKKIRERRIARAVLSEGQTEATDVSEDQITGIGY